MSPTISPFEFLLALYVILAGLGLTLIIRSVGQIIEARERIQLYWVHTAWVCLIFVAHLTNWFVFWEFRKVGNWTIGKFLLLISVPTMLYLVSHISVPEMYDRDGRYDMRKHFYRRYRLVLGLLVATLLINITAEWLLLGMAELSLLNILRMIILVSLCTGMISSSPRLHGLVVVLLVMVLTFGITVLTNELD